MQAAFLGEGVRLCPISFSTFQGCAKGMRRVGKGQFRLLSAPNGECRLNTLEGGNGRIAGSRVALILGPAQYELKAVGGQGNVRQLDFMPVKSQAPLLFSAPPCGVDAWFRTGPVLFLEDDYGIVPVTFTALNAASQGDEKHMGAVSEMALNGMLLCLKAGLVKGYDSGAPDNAHVLLALDYIHANYMNNIGAADIAAWAGVHPNYLHRLFLSRTGSRLLPYITGYRLKKARALLVTTDLPIPQIALATGFSNRRYFSQIFQKNLGLTPQAFRKTYDVTCDYARASALSGDMRYYPLGATED